jgi:hypothetical protein
MVCVTRSAALALVIVAAALAAGCGDAGQGDTQRQVGPDVTVFVGSTLDDVPVPPRAEPLGPVHEERDGIRVRSWEVRNSTVADVMEFYRELLRDRPVISPVEDAPGAAEVLRGEWLLEDGILRVTTQAAPTLDDADNANPPSVQLSLQLTPR